MRTTCQFNTKIFYPSGDKHKEKPHLWSSDSLENYGFDDAQLCFYADGCALDLSEDGTSYSIKSATNEASIVNLTVKRIAPGFQVGKDGKSYFGTDPENPWGSMRHAFWPRCAVTGTIMTKDGDVDFTGQGLFVHALQGMKPHHAGMAHDLLYPEAIGTANTLLSRQVEICQLPIPDVLGRNDGVHHPALIRLLRRQRRRPRP